MKRLVTHEFPHLDDIAAIWLWKSYVPGWSKSRVEFVTLKGQGEAATWKNEPVDSDPNVVHVGVGRGKFDEHKGDVGKCATLLVHEFLVTKKYVHTQDRKAVERLVEFVNLQDTGALGSMPHQPMYLPSLLRGIKNSVEREELGEYMLSLALERYREKVAIDQALAKGIEVLTGWGKGIAVQTDAAGPESNAYTAGYTFIIHVDPKRKWRSVRALANSQVDLTEMYEIVIKLEPKAGWYLHQAHKMIMCGSRSAPNVVMSKLSLKKMIEIVKHVAPGTNKGKA